MIQDATQSRVRATLEPLRRVGARALRCSDVPGIHVVKLQELHLAYADSNGSRIVLKGDDVFETLRAVGLRGFPRARMMSATLLARDVAHEEHRVTIVPSHQNVLQPDAVPESVLEFLTRRGFFGDEHRGLAQLERDEA